MTRKPSFARALLLTASVLPLCAAPVFAADDKELLERLKRQDEQIEALKQQVKDLTAIVNQRITKVETATENGKVVMNGLPTRLESQKGDYSLQFVGNLQVTAGFFDQSHSGAGALVLNNGVNVRRAQLGVQGTAFKDFTYTSVFDLSATGGVASAVRDLTIAYSGFAPLTITIGNQKPQSGLEASFSDRSNAQTFIEPAMTTDLATALSTRYLGVRASTGGANYSASVGLFGDDINSNSVFQVTKPGWGMHGRATYAPIAEADKVIHLGVSGYWRRVAIGRTTLATDPVVRQLRFRSRPELTVDGQRLVDTGNLTTAVNSRFIGGEFAAVYGPFNLQSEYQQVWINQGPSKMGVSFNSAYLEGSYVLTGESRVYDAKNGVFSRFKPSRNFDPSKNSWGAWEIATRISYMDLNDHPNQIAAGGIRGGYQTDYTAGLNWYWNSFFRLQFNYIRADYRNNNGVNTAGNKSTDANIFAIRAHQEF